MSIKKHVFLTLCILALAALFFACTADAPDEPSTSPDTPDTDKADYASLACRDYAAFQPLSFGKESGAYALTVALPTSWVSVPDEAGIGFYLDGEEVARIEAGSAIDSDYLPVASELLAGDGFDIDVFVEQKGEGKKADFRRVIRFWYAEGEREQAITLTADYTALSDVGVAEVIAEAALRPAFVHSFLSLHERESLSVLILGNSFISTSKVGSLLREICQADGREVTVHAISRGYARVSTYTADEALMAQIRAGEYDAVFQCGFYGAEQVEHLATMRAACETSDTPLLLFPAHNENASVLASARRAQPDLLYLDWKGEIEGFIDGGVPLWDLCADDSHRHSTSLAGYIGAHIIYRALFGEAPGTVPTLFLNGARVGEDFVRDSLGEDYLTTPAYPLLTDVIYLP